VNTVHERVPVPAGATTLDGLRHGLDAPLVLPNAPRLIREANKALSAHVVVLDDDPTGSQVVHDVPVLVRWTDDDLLWAFRHPAHTVFILTNTRSLGRTATRELLVDLAQRIHRAAAKVGVEVVLLSRGDSTLRGHFPLETDVLAEEAVRRGQPYDAIVLAPAYLDAGRVTVGDTHFVRAGSAYIPVGETEYASDAAFGYRSSSLPRWVREKAGAEVPVTSLSLHDIRAGGVERVFELLLAARKGAVVVVNALDDNDLQVVALALAQAEATGWRALCRVGPSFVPARAGIERRTQLRPEEITDGSERRGYGLVVVGSHVPLSTRQLKALLELPDIETVELAVPELLDPADAAAELNRCSRALRSAATSADVVLVTSRQRVDTVAGESSLELSRTVSAALVELTRRLAHDVELGWVVAKGGITSHDVAAHGLGIHRATVLGQMFPGIVSVWRTEPAMPDDPAGPAGEGDLYDGRTVLSGLPYVVFAGNVGDTTTLRDAVEILRRAHHA